MAKSLNWMDDPSHKGKTNTWLTPKWLLDELGEFDLDPCAAPEPRPWATAKEMWSLPTDGLSKEWFGRVWLNPPYGEFTNTFINHLIKHGNGIALVFARTDTKWFQNGIWSATGTFLIEKRIKFCLPDGSVKTNAGIGSVLMCFGKNNVQAVMRSNLQGKML